MQHEAEANAYVAAERSPAAIKEPTVAGNVGNMKTICKWLKTF